MNLKLSTFAHLFEHPGDSNVFALWHALTMDLIFVARPLAEIVQRAGNGSLDDSLIKCHLVGSEREKEVAVQHLLDTKILVPDTVDESMYPLALAKSFEETRFIGVLYLMLFDGCNFACQYCFEDTHEPTRFKPKRMSKEVAKAGLDLFARLTARYPPPDSHELKVQLYGGEPTLNWTVFRDAVTYFRELQRAGILDSRIGLATVTNGSNMTKDRAEFLAGNDVSVGISLDGPRDLNNRYRITKSGKDSFDIAIDALRLLRNANAKVGVSVTLTPEVVDNFTSVLTFLHSDLGVARGLGFNILHHTNAVPVGAEYYKKAASCIIQAFQLFRETGVWEDRAMRKVVSFVNQHPLHSDCAAIGRQIVVSPEGTIGICQDYIRDRTGFRSTVFDASFDPFDSGEFVDWSMRSPFRMKECYLCPALGICGGGCPASSEAVTGSIWNVDERICPHSLETLQFLIWDTYAAQRT